MRPVTTDADASPGAARSCEPIDVVELPTLVLLFVTFAVWLAMTFAYRFWPLAVVAPAVAIVLTLHSSLQHELTHGHPTRNPVVNRLLGSVPLSLWLPFELYRREHLQHHDDERLTDPVDDPESYYWTPDGWRGLGPIARLSLTVQQTLAGRIVIGSFWRIGMFLKNQMRAILENRTDARAVWLEHLLWCVPVVMWVRFVCGMPLWLYVAAMVIPGNGILLIRSFAEHRARPGVRQRIAIVEGSRILGPLFLFNNLHSLHHEAPMIPWYRYNAVYRLDRERLIAENGGLVYSTYFDVARRYLFRAHDAPVHPTGRVPEAVHAPVRAAPKTGLAVQAGAG